MFYGISPNYCLGWIGYYYLVFKEIALGRICCCKTYTCNNLKLWVLVLNETFSTGKAILRKSHSAVSNVAEF